MIKLNFKPFQDFIEKNTNKKSRSRYLDSFIAEIDLSFNKVEAKVMGTSMYDIRIVYSIDEVKSAFCSCPYSGSGYCKHIIHVLVETDSLIDEKYFIKKSEEPDQQTADLNLIQNRNGIYQFDDVFLIELTAAQISRVAEPRKINWRNTLEVIKATLTANKLEATISVSYSRRYKTTVEQTQDFVLMTCDCQSANPNKICSHLHETLYFILSEKKHQLAFNTFERQKLYTKVLKNSGLSGISNPDEYLEIEYEYGSLQVKLTNNILNFSDQYREHLKVKLLPTYSLKRKKQDEKQMFIVIYSEEYSDKCNVKLMEAPLTKAGKIKNPIQEVDILRKIKNNSDYDLIKFYSSFIKDDDSSYVRYEFIGDVINNPLDLPTYHFDEYKWNTDTITRKKLEKIQIEKYNQNLTIHVKKDGDLYGLRGKLKLGEAHASIDEVDLTIPFLVYKDTFYYVGNLYIMNLIHFIKDERGAVLIHQSNFDDFKAEFLDPLEEIVDIKYEFVKKAPKKLLKNKQLDTISKRLIYLSEEEDFILITPAMTYGEVEVPVLSRITVYTEGENGQLYSIERDETAEHRFLRTIIDQHPSFEEEVPSTFFYLSKEEFLDDGWFINAFEEWRNLGYQILGFKKLKNNNFNEHKMKVSTSVSTGIDWFDIHAEVSFGDQSIGLKQIQKSIKNKSRYVELGDGTRGVLPTEWINKFGSYFRSGEVKENGIRTHKSNFQLIDDLFDKEVLSDEVKIELEEYREKLANFHSIRNINVPKKLKATLRDYQKEGLNWLNFLDEFQFGGILADDMGLGKTIQIITYILSQHEKGEKDPNFVIVPTSLLFNWENEIEKFAPHLKYISVYGPQRNIEEIDFSKYDVVLTTYGTLLSDINWYKDYPFNLIILDESQAIKNPSSKRYKAVRLLQGKQRIAMTGTPVENNTFDLFSQLSFVMPGLLGSALQFKSDYSTPIDKFQDADRAKELQQKVHPFILRRTKKQVAKELPEKTEMVVYCEMGAKQKRVYDLYKAEFQSYLTAKDDDEIKKSKLHILQGLMKLRQICNSPVLLSDEEYYGSDSAKLEELHRQINQLKGEHKILVFSQFVGMLEIIKERLDKENIKYAYLTGKTRKRETVVEQFQNDDETRVFLISLKAGGMGLNLTQAEYVFIVDPWWNPAVENQAIDRAYRIGQKNKVMAIRLITPNSIEEKIMDLQKRKEQLVEDLIHTDQGMLKKLGKDELLALVE